MILKDLILQNLDIPDQSDSIIQYETALKTYFNAKYCIAVSSGTAALLVALKILDLKRDDEIIMPPTAPLCTAYPVIASGGSLLFSDTNENNFGLDLGTLTKRITKKTKAILEVPMWGYPIEAPSIQKLAKEKSIPLIFDLAHCIGTYYHNQPLSKFCDIACFSTQKNKIFSTGEGGFILTDNEEYYQKALSYSRMGNLDGIHFGLNFRLSHLLAEKGLIEMDQLKNNLSLRTTQSQSICKAINNPKIQEIEIIHSCSPSYQRLLLQTKNSESSLAYYLQNYGIPSDMIKYNIKPLYDYEALKPYRVACPNAENLLLRTTTIPVNIKYTEKELQHLIAAINLFPN